MRPRPAAIGFAAGASVILHAVGIGWHGSADERATALQTVATPAMTARWVQTVDAKSLRTSMPKPKPPKPMSEPMPKVELSTAPAQPSPLSRFYPREMLDRPALPRSDVNSDMLEGVDLSGLPIRVRVYIDELGRVVDAKVSIATELDARAQDAVRNMFFATSYIAARHEGRDVASYQDVQIEFTSPP